MSLRIGIDVGGTNTDAVLMDGSDGRRQDQDPDDRGRHQRHHHRPAPRARHVRTATDAIAGVMIGTTHFTNAVVERRRLQPTAAVRLGLPATAALPPMVDWPDDLRDSARRSHLPLPRRPRVRRARDLASSIRTRSGRRRRHRGQGHHRDRRLVRLLAGQPEDGGAGGRDPRSRSARASA